MTRIHCITVPVDALSHGPCDLREQVENRGKVPYREMSSDAAEVFRKQWDKNLDGRPWPPAQDDVLMGFPR